MKEHPFPITPEHYLDLWLQALGTELGIVVLIDDPQDTIPIMNKLYEARKDVGDPRLAQLAIHVPEDGASIYIYKKEVDLDD